ncbi:L-lactate dehydrogenase [Streptococcus thoraltensis]|uniref:L-lactate dehydrogenase n=1 Tax=Streptococcus thoraltensis TaxID=55085 RepID=UPI000368B6DA|nr:L-lactate dehydrogenase [Streptococcus thoraltensis]MDY4762372.1 L-lactate dehydrogenase [Streptococcus thoraltensis]
MARKIGIIGMGNVGSTLAHGLISEAVADHYVLIDPREEKVRADQIDFQDAMANHSSFAKITINDYAALADADVVVSALGNISLQHNADEDRFAEFALMQEQVPQVAASLKGSGFSGVLVVISNPVDAVSALYQALTGFPKERVIGTGTLLDTARMKRVVSERLGVNPKSVSGYNLGEHGNSQFTAWSQVSVKGQSIDHFFSEEELEEMSFASMKGGHTVFYGKGYTSYGIATTAIRIVKAILSDAEEELVISSYQDEFETYVGYPALVGRKGKVGHVPLSLTENENTKLQASANLIKDRVETALEKLL